MVLRDKPPVVADHHQRGARAGKLAREPLDRREVEMVRRLVEQKDIGGRGEHARERRPSCFAAG
jgi:hypothetical protein